MNIKLASEKTGLTKKAIKYYEIDSDEKRKSFLGVN